MRRKAAILETHGKSIRIPPGSVGRACIQRGSSGTWESQVFPCRRIRSKGYRRKGKLPVFGEKLQLPKRASKRGTQTKRSTVRYRGRIAKSERT